MPEYIFTNLPQYVTVTPRSAFANSVVQSGAVLLFSEDGTTLTAKLPDGSFIPVGGGSGGATDYYKCATVDTVNLTWTGYKAVFDAVTGTYSFESTATSGLTWNLIQPQVGKVYTADAMIRVELYTGLPLAGLDFYLPLSEGMNDTVHNYAVDTSQDYDSEFTITSDTTGGFLRCSKQYGSSSRIYWPDTANQYAYGTDDFAISFWLRAPDWSTNYDGSQIILNKKSDDSTTGMAFHRGYHSDNLSLRVAYQNDLFTTANVTNSGWVHWCIVRENGVGYWYRNGVLNATGTMSGSFTSSEPFNIGYHGQSGWESTALFDLKALRIYNRALTAAEVAALAAEFTPSAGA